MRKVTFLFALIIVVIFFGISKTSIDTSQMVNPIIGDISFELKYGEKPNENTNNYLRIVTHLEYVENILRKKDVSNLTQEQRIKRKDILDLLHEYWTKGIFPKNYDFKDQRKPCFIDKDGNICAVGYIVEQTTNRETAKKINKKYKYNELLDMNDDLIDDWVKTSGLTKEECAMIQPTYGSPSYSYSYNYISPAYGISSSVLGGLNLSLNTINGIQIANNSNNKAVPIIGLFTGTSQIIMGSYMFNESQTYWYGINESKKSLSMVNIGLGTSTVFLSAWNLISNRKQKNKLTSWNVYSFPTPNENLGLAFSWSKKF